MAVKKRATQSLDELLKKAQKEKQPDFIPPMLATLTEDYFSSDEWIYEHKFDGERCLAFKKNGKVRLRSRNNRSMNDEYPELVTALEKQIADDFIIDGEIVALNREGISDFQLLQGRINVRSVTHLEEIEVPIYYRIFDLLYVGGYNITHLPLLARKALLKKLLRYNKMLNYTEHHVGDGVALFKKACAAHWEGLIAKKIDSTYVSKRSPSWLKFKCSAGQELIIIGYTEPKGSRAYFGALLVGYYDHGKLMYAGKVGTGYTQATLEMIGKKLKKLETKKKLVTNYTGTLRGVHWVKPVLVAEFKFAQWTRDNRLRVGRYQGLRDDKKAAEVVKETPK